MFWSVKNVRWIFSLKMAVLTSVIVALSLSILPGFADDAPAANQDLKNDSASTPSKADDAAAANAPQAAPDAIPDEVTTKPVASDAVPQKPSIWSANGLEDFEFTDRSGKLVTRKDLLGKEWVIGFMFTRCRGPCPMIVAAMKKLQDETKVNMVLFTVDPENDTPEVLRRFSESYVPASKPSISDDTSGAAPQWYWLTGPREKLLTYIQKNFRVPAFGRAGAPEHSNSVMHIDESARVMGKYLGVESAEMALLRRIIQKKAPRGKMMTDVIPPGAIQMEGAPAGMTFTRTRDPEDEVQDNPASASDADDTTDRDIKSNVPAWILKLPAVNASLNGLATLLLVMGFVLIKLKRPTAHKVVMLSCFATSIVFLGFYCVYHAFVLSKKFPGIGPIRYVYFTILISHIILAATVPFLASMTIYRGLTEQWARHRSIARITFPIWLYVSVTGVIIYFMLYQWPAA